MKNQLADILVITPDYPTNDNQYFGGFVHSRCLSYKKNGLSFEVVSLNRIAGSYQYTYEGIPITSTDITEGLRNILERKKYRCIIVHFFDINHFKAITSSVKNHSTPVIIIAHGHDVLYNEQHIYRTSYDSSPQKSTFLYDSIYNAYRDFIVKYIAKDNKYTWTFVSHDLKERGERLIGCSFKNYHIIPNIIDEDFFNFGKTSQRNNKNIIVMRRYPKDRKYAIDIVVATIHELSTRKIFDDLHFHILGKGAFKKDFFRSIKKYSNVTIRDTFYSKKELAKTYQTIGGIALFPTRYDSQGVSACEAAACGSAVITCDEPAIKEFFPSQKHSIITTKSPIDFANAIEALATDKQLFDKIRLTAKKSINNKCSYHETTKREIDLIHSVMHASKNSVATYPSARDENVTQKTEKLLSVIIPVYNVEKYLRRCLFSLLNVEKCYQDKLHIIIINDGSTDQSLNIAKKIKRDSTVDIEIVTKKNGHWGSAINTGLKHVKGKYFKIVDSDDYVLTKNFQRLLIQLEKENVDLILNNFFEDRPELLRYIPTSVFDNFEENTLLNINSLYHQPFGFKSCGPTISTATYNSTIIPKIDFLLTEGLPYTDVEFVTFTLPLLSTVKYFDFPVYIYFLGRGEEQTVSLASKKANYHAINHLLMKLSDFCHAHRQNTSLYRFILHNIYLTNLHAQLFTLHSFFRACRLKKALFSQLKSKYPQIYKDMGAVDKKTKITEIMKAKFIQFFHKKYLYILPYGCATKLMRGEIILSGPAKEKLKILLKNTIPYGAVALYRKLNLN